MCERVNTCAYRLPLLGTASITECGEREQVHDIDWI